jgi:hypothetical protein
MKYIKRAAALFTCLMMCSVNVLADTTDTLIEAWKTASAAAQGNTYTSAGFVSVNSVDAWKKAVATAAENLDDEIVIEINGFNYTDYDLKHLYDYNYSVNGLGYARDGYAKITYRFIYNSNYKLIRTVENRALESKLTTEEKYVFDTVIKKAAELTKNATSDYEKELAIHDYIVGTYSYTQLAEGESYTLRKHQIIGMVVDGNGVCEAYAELFRLMGKSVGLEIYNAEGSMNGVDHMWNIVKLDGELYHVDCTADDPSPDVLGRLRHTYFNVNDSEISSDHIWENKGDMSCTATKYNYFVYNNYIVRNSEELAEFISNQYDKGEKNISFKTVGYSINSSTAIRNVLAEKGCKSFGLVGDYGSEGVYTIIING